MMGLKVDIWAIAFRKKCEELWKDNSSFQMLPMTFKGCYADPFLFEWEGDTYLFAEYVSFRRRRGTIAYAKFDPAIGTFGKFHEIIREDYHLSYPLVFMHNREIYMMPEANESHALYVYKAVKFPEEWEKHAVLMDDIRLVDTTPFFDHGSMYAITKKNDTPQDPMMLLRIDPDTWKVTDAKIVTDDVSISRPGGHVYALGGQTYMVTQDCEKDYGTALNILSFSVEEDGTLSYRPEKKITADDVRVKEVEHLSGIHTYNFSSQWEVIDFKYKKWAFYRAFWKLIRKFKKI